MIPFFVAGWCVGLLCGVVAVFGLAFFANWRQRSAHREHLKQLDAAMGRMMEELASHVRARQSTPKYPGAEA